MNDTTHAAYGGYLRTLADALLLRDWEIELVRQWADDGSYAQALAFHQENHLEVRITEGIAGHAASDVREWFVHELLHAHMGRLDRIAAHFVDIRNDDGAHLFEKEHDDESEVVVQRLARIIAPFMPLPPEAAV